MSFQKLILLFRKPRVAILGAMISLLLVLFGWAAYNQNSAQASLARANELSSQGKFAEAIDALNKGKTYWSLPGTKSSILKLLEQNTAWSGHQKDLLKIGELYAAGDFASALSLCETIPDDSPLFSLASSMRAKIDAAIAQKAANEEAERMAAEKAAQEAAKQPNKKKQTTTTGKKFTSTSAKTALAAAQSLEQVEAAMDSFLGQYNIDANIANVSNSTYGSSVSWTLLSAGDLGAMKSYGAIFIDEWAKYPTGFVAKSKLREVNFIHHVTVNGQDRTAMPDPYGKEMFYAPATAHIVHHEYAHYYEFIFKGAYVWGETEWKKYNPAGFSYGAGGATAYGAAPIYASYEHPISGFVTEYGTYGLEEDRAELAGYLFEGSQYKRLKSWMTTDTNLAAKVSIYKSFLASQSSELSGTYFEDINP